MNKEKNLESPRRDLNPGPSLRRVPTVVIKDYTGTIYTSEDYANKRPVPDELRAYVHNLSLREIEGWGWAKNRRDVFTAYDYATSTPQQLRASIEMMVRDDPLHPDYETLSEQAVLLAVARGQLI